MIPTARVCVNAYVHTHIPPITNTPTNQTPTLKPQTPIFQVRDLYPALLQGKHRGKHHVRGAQPAAYGGCWCLWLLGYGYGCLELCIAVHLID